uniref:Signal peptidase II n=1 Tax=Panagrellus redivivus TaxID=6233 RepID=A0A7E4VQ86_PANRE
MLDDEVNPISVMIQWQKDNEVVFDIQELFFDLKAFKTYKDFVNTIRYSVKQNYQPIESVHVTRRDGTTYRMNEHKFSLDKDCRYYVKIANCTQEIKKIRARFEGMEQRYLDFFAKRGQ